MLYLMDNQQVNSIDLPLAFVTILIITIFCLCQKQRDNGNSYLVMKVIIELRRRQGCEFNQILRDYTLEPLEIPEGDRIF